MVFVVAKRVGRDEGGRGSFSEQPQYGTTDGVVHKLSTSALELNDISVTHIELEGNATRSLESLPGSTQRVRGPFEGFIDFLVGCTMVATDCTDTEILHVRPSSKYLVEWSHPAGCRTFGGKEEASAIVCQRARRSLPRESDEATSGRDSATLPCCHDCHRQRRC